MKRTEITVRGSVGCIVTARKRVVTAEVIDYAGGSPTKYDVEDALYAAREWARSAVRGLDATARFAHSWTDGEVAVYTLAG